MDSGSGSTRKSKRTPVPKKSFDLVERYESSSFAKTGTLTAAEKLTSEEKKKASKPRTVVKAAGKRLFYARKEKIDPDTPVSVQSSEEPLPNVVQCDEPKSTQKHDKRRGKKTSGIDNSLQALDTSLPTPPKLIKKEPVYLEEINVDEGATNADSELAEEATPSGHASSRVNHDQLRQKGTRKRKHSKYPVEKETRQSVEIPVEQPAITDNSSIVENTYTAHQIETGTALATVTKEPKLTLEHTKYTNPVESDIFINSCNLIPEQKKLKKHKKRKKTISASEDKSEDQELHEQKKNEPKICKVTENEKGHLVLTVGDLHKNSSDGRKVDALPDPPETENLTSVSGGTVAPPGSASKKSVSPKKKQKRKSSTKSNKITDKNVVISAQVTPDMLEIDKTIDTVTMENIDTAEATDEETVQFSDGTGEQTKQLRIKKRKVYKRKHGERILVRIVTEVQNDAGEVISSSVEDLKGKKTTSKMHKEAKETKKKKKHLDISKQKQRQSKSTKKTKRQSKLKSNAKKEQVPTTPELKLTSPSRKKVDGGGKEFKKMQTLTAYILYCRKHRKRVVAEYPTYSFAQISRKLGELWNNTPETEKGVYRIQLEEHKAKVHSALRKIKLKTTGFSDDIDDSVDDMPSPLCLSVAKRAAARELDIPTYSTSNLEPIDFASHLVLLGESLTMISSALFQQDQQTVHGSLSVLLDSAVCAIAPLLFMTSSVPEMDAVSDECKAKVLDNISYILPGV